jgi:hypothetical protein
MSKMAIFSLQIIMREKIVRLFYKDPNKLSIFANNNIRQKIITDIPMYNQKLALLPTAYSCLDRRIANI